jgi:molecular chaperone DnaJ
VRGASTGGPAVRSPSTSRSLASIRTHYDVLGVAPDADATALRTAYRERARMHHPDRASADSAAEMAAINEAYRVLADPGRRAAYDRSLSIDVATPERSAGPWTAGRPGETVAPLPPARMPWKLMAGMAVLGVLVVLVGAVLIEPAAEAPPDGLLRSGSCVEIEANGDAREVNCSQSSELVVTEIVALDDPCPVGTLGYRDRQGLGTACVTQPGN